MFTRLAKEAFDAAAERLLRAADAFTKALFHLPGARLDRFATYRGSIFRFGWEARGISPRGTSFPYEEVRDLHILGGTDGRDWYISMIAPKVYAKAYYPESLLIPERFPPLSELVSTKSACMASPLLHACGQRNETPC